MTLFLLPFTLLTLFLRSNLFSGLNFIFSHSGTVKLCSVATISAIKETCVFEVHVAAILVYIYNQRRNWFLAKALMHLTA
jgi:hypothetical protein